MELHCHPKAPISIIEEASNTTHVKHTTILSPILPACPQPVSLFSPNIGEPSATRPVFGISSNLRPSWYFGRYRGAGISISQFFNLSGFQFRSSGRHGRVLRVREKHLGLSLYRLGSNLAEDACGTSQHLALAHIGYTRLLALLSMSPMVACRRRCHAGVPHRMRRSPPQDACGGPVRRSCPRRFRRVGRGRGPRVTWAGMARSPRRLPRQPADSPALPLQHTQRDSRPLMFRHDQL